jgi:hypothetical protein
MVQRSVVFRTRNSRRPRVVLGALLFAGIVAFAPYTLGQQSSHSIPSVTAAVGTSANVSILATITSEADAFSLGVLHRSPALTVTGVTAGAAVAALTALDISVPEFFEVNITPALPAADPTVLGGFTVGLIFDFDVLAPVRLSSGIDQELLIATYSIDPLAPPQLAALEFTGSLGSPPVDLVTVLSVLDTPIEVIPTISNGTLAIDSAIFVRGDVDGSGSITLLDGVLILYRTAGLMVAGDCPDADDVNDSGVLDILDAAYLFQYMFAGGALPPAPFTVCGDDQTNNDIHGCAVSTCP